MSHQATTWVMGFSQSRLTDRLVLLAIAHRISNDDGEAFPSVGTIAREANVSESSVHTSLRQLKRMGEIEIDQAASKLTTNLYRMPKFLAWWRGLHPEGGGAKSAPPGRRGICTQGVQSTEQRGAKSAPEPSGTIIEPSGSARSEIAESEGAQRKNPQKRANPFPIGTSNKNTIRANVSRLAQAKGIPKLNPHRNPEIAHLEAGIFRHHVSAAYSDSVHHGLSHKEGFGEALDQAILSLLSHRGAVELRGVREESLRGAAWTRLAVFVKPLAHLSDYSRREDQVVSTIVRVVVDEAIRLKNLGPESNRCVALPMETTPIAAAVNG